MNEQLPAFKIKQGRRIYDIYNIVNSFSFALVTGNTITLYALILHANTTIVGLLNAFMYLSYFAIPLGRIMVGRFTIMQTFGYTWFLRNIALIPLIVIPYLVACGLETAALYCLLTAVVLFNVFRGAGMIANNPVIKILAPGKDRSSYIVRISLINNLAALIATVALAFLLQFDSSVHSYNLAVVVGIILGFIASALLFKLPEPQQKKPQCKKAGSGAACRTQTFPPVYGSFKRHVHDAFSDTNFRRFVVVFFIISFGICMIRPFIIVYAKEVYAQQDSRATILAVFFIFGALAVGLIMRLVIDRIGAKPMYTIFTAITGVALIPALFAPWAAQGGFFAFVFLIAVSFLTNMGFVGQDNAAQAYFFAMVPEDALMDLSMLYYFILGITGGAASILGGTVLDSLKLYGFSPVIAYRIFFIGVVIILIAGMLVQRKLRYLGSYPVFQTLAVLFSPRDMRALNLLHKLDTNENIVTEQKILTELGEIASVVSCDQLLNYLKSPRLTIRLKALNALYCMDYINPRIKNVLLEELKSGTFTTAPIAAKTLGKCKAVEAIPALRAALDSSDYYLVGEAMVALATMRDTYSQFKIAALFAAAENSALLLKGIAAMEIYDATSSISFILDLIRRKNIAPQIEQEAVLALSSLLGVENEFYYIFERYLHGNIPTALISDVLEETFSVQKHYDETLKNIVLAFLSDFQHDREFSRWVLRFGDEKFGVRTALLIGVALDMDLICRKSFRFFLAFWAVCLYKTPVLLEK